jgi:S-adenosylmethionine hydrolase
MPYFPPGTVFLCVVDPGVGSNREPLLIDCDGRIFIGPNNGIFTYIIDQKSYSAWQISNSNYFLHNVSATFHGRDIFAPIAAHISKGLPLSFVGNKISHIKTIALPRLQIQHKQINGEIQFFDKFGNGITSIGKIELSSDKSATLTPWIGKEASAQIIPLKDITIKVLSRGEYRTLKLVRTFSDVPVGHTAAIIGSSGMVEIIANCASAEQVMDLHQGDFISLIGKGEKIMTNKFIIEGGVPLFGEVTPSGNKNAALPLLAATLLTNEPIILSNIPLIGDVFAMRHLLEGIGVVIEEISSNKWKIKAENIQTGYLDEEICQNIRASILLAGPLLARHGEVHLPPPGGDVIGRRRLDTHLIGLRALGADIQYEPAFKRISFKAQRLTGAEILLDEASVTATENVIMAAVTAKGTPLIRNAASEPHIQELCVMLNQMGAKISHIGSNLLYIEGVDSLHGTEFKVGS